MILKLLRRDGVQRRAVQELQLNKSVGRRTKSTLKKVTKPAVETPKPINKPDSSNPQTDMSAIYSHMGLALMGISYMNPDIYFLRLTAIGSLATSMISQHRLKQSALFRWNALFIGINAAWILSSYYEETLSEEFQQVYTVLQEKGDMISQEDFKKLFKAAKREVRNRGDVLMSEGFACKEMCFIESGRAVVSRKGIILGSVGDGDFTGPVDLNINTRQEDSKERLQTRDEQAIDLDSKTDTDFSTVEVAPLTFEEEDENACMSTETIAVESETMVLWTWDHADLNDLDRNLKTSIFAYMHQSTKNHLQDAWSAKIVDDKEKARLQQIAVDYLFNGIITADNTQVNESPQVNMTVLNESDDFQLKEKKK